jgi:hypothetical protein
VIAMTEHPDHRFRVFLWSLDDNGQPRWVHHGFTELPSAVGFQRSALKRPDVLRADLMLLLNSSTQPEQVTEARDIREDMRDRLVAIRKE